MRLACEPKSFFKKERPSTGEGRLVFLEWVITAAVPRLPAAGRPGLYFVGAECGRRDRHPGGAYPPCRHPFLYDCPAAPDGIVSPRPAVAGSVAHELAVRSAEKLAGSVAVFAARSRMCSRRCPPFAGGWSCGYL